MRAIIKNPDISLILPCYNEDQHLERSIEEILAVLRNSRYSFEIILIDDKSTDDTPRLIKKVAKKNKEIRVFFNKKNKKRGATVKEGMLKAKAKIVGYIDIDLEVAPDYIPRFVRLIKENKTDVATGLRHYPFHLYPANYFLREIGTRVYIFLARFFLGLPFNDTEAGYKFFNKEKVMPILKRTQNPHWFWDTEIITRSFLQGLSITEIPVLFLRNSKKTSTVKLLPDTISYLRAIYNFKKKIGEEYKEAPGILYKFPRLYPLAMKFLFGSSYEERYKTISKLVDRKSSVIDVCCGDAKLASHLNNTSYLGLDISRNFVIFNNKRGIRTRLFDVAKDQIPQSDFVIMQGSLYQFKKPSEIVRKLFKAATKTLVISESVHHLEGNPFMKIFVGTENENPDFRFTEVSFKKLLKKYNPTYFKIKGGRDLVAVIKKQ